MLNWRRLGAGFAPLVIVLLAACGEAPASTSTPTSVPPTVVVTPTAGVAPTRTVEKPTEVVRTPVPTQTASSEPIEPPVDLTNPFPKILGAAPAPEGWSVEPCAGNAPYLCMQEGEQSVGYVSLNSYPLETLPDFQAMLTEAGVDAEAFDYKNPAHAARARGALTAFVESYHENIMQDREITFGSAKTYERLETEEINVGELPGLRYGFVLMNEDGSVYERWLSFSTFDGEGLFTIVAPFDPNPEQSFRSDEDLLKFEPFLVEIIEGLKMPHPEVRGDKIRG